MGTSERRLAAVLVGDIVGYSELVFRDEDSTLTRVKSAFELIYEVVERHGGRVVKTMGDGFIAEFASVIIGFEAAREILVNIGSGEEDLLTLRMGLHVGDIIFQADGDIVGNGVNIASRLESFARPGHIAISGRAADELRRREIEFTYRGSHRLKNIADPVDVYEYGSTGGTIRWRYRFTVSQWKRVTSIAILACCVGLAYWFWPRAGYNPDRDLASIPCSWLRVNDHSAVEGRQVWKIGGYSIQTAGQLKQLLMQRSIDNNETDAVFLLDQLIPIAPKQCNWVEKIRRFGYFGTPMIHIVPFNQIKPSRIDDPYYNGMKPLSGSVAARLLSINDTLLRRPFFIYAIEPNGTISYLADRKIFDEASTKPADSGDEKGVVIYQDHGGSSAFIVLEADQAPPKGLVERQVADIADIQRFDEVARANHWSFSLVQDIANEPGLRKEN